LFGQPDRLSPASMMLPPRLISRVIASIGTASVVRQSGWRASSSRVSAPTGGGVSVGDVTSIGALLAVRIPASMRQEAIALGDRFAAAAARAGDA